MAGPRPSSDRLRASALAAGAETGSRPGSSGGRSAASRADRSRRLPRGRRHAVLEGLARSPRRKGSASRSPPARSSTCWRKRSRLLLRVVQLREAVGDLHAARVELEPVDPFGVRRVAAWRAARSRSETRGGRSAGRDAPPRPPRRARRGACPRPRKRSGLSTPNRTRRREQGLGSLRSSSGADGPPRVAPA